MPLWESLLPPVTDHPLACWVRLPVLAGPQGLPRRWPREAICRAAVDYGWTVDERGSHLDIRVELVPLGTDAAALLFRLAADAGEERGVLALTRLVAAWPWKAVRRGRELVLAVPPGRAPAEVLGTALDRILARRPAEAAIEEALRDPLPLSALQGAGDRSEPPARLMANGRRRLDGEFWRYDPALDWLVQARNGEWADGAVVDGFAVIRGKWLYDGFRRPFQARDGWWFGVADLVGAMNPLAGVHLQVTTLAARRLDRGPDCNPAALACALRAWPDGDKLLVLSPYPVKLPFRGPHDFLGCLGLFAVRLGSRPWQEAAAVWDAAVQMAREGAGPLTIRRWIQSLSDRDREALAGLRALAGRE